MNIYVARNGGGNVIGIVLACSRKVAEAYFIGRGEVPHDVRVIRTDDESNTTGLIEVYKTRSMSWSEMRSLADRRAMSCSDPVIVEDKS